MRNKANFPSLANEELIPRGTVGEESPFASSLDILLKIWEQRRFLLKATVLGGIVATAIALLLPKQYESTTLLMPPDRNRGDAMGLLSGMLNEKVGALASEAIGGQTPGALFIQVLRSRTAEDQLIQRFDLRQVYGTKLWLNARQRLAGDTDITEDRKSGVITITVRAKSPELAAGLARGYVEALNGLIAQLDTSAAHRERLFLEQRVSQVKAQLDQDAKLLSDFSTKNNTLDIQVQGKAMVEGAAKLQGELIAAESELRGLEEIYGPENARVRAASAKAGELGRQLKNIEGATDNNQPGYPSIHKLPEIGAKYSDLYRKVKVQEAVFENLTKQYELAKVQEARDVPSVRVLDEADVPEKKLRPRRTLTVLAGAFLAFVLASAYVIAAIQWQAVAPDAPTKRFVSQIHRDLVHDRQRLLLGNSRETPGLDQNEDQ